MTIRNIAFRRINLEYCSGIQIDTLPHACKDHSDSVLGSDFRSAVQAVQMKGESINLEYARARSAEVDRQYKANFCTG